MTCKNHKHPPEPNRFMVCKGYDWTEFACKGMFIPYKPGSPKKLVGKSRFCIQKEDGTFDSDRETWKDVDSWEYADEPR